MISVLIIVSYFYFCNKARTLLMPWGRVLCIDKTTCFLVNCTSLPSSLDGIRNRNHSKRPRPSELNNQTPPTKLDRVQFGAYGLSQSEAFPPLSPYCSDIDGECDITLHIKVSAPIHSGHLVTCRSPRHFVALCSEAGALNRLLFQAVVD